MKTTRDCKSFLVMFFAANPQIIHAIYATSSTADIAEVQAAATSMKEWKREYKCKPGRGDYEFESYTIHEDGCRMNRFAEPISAPSRSPENFVWERGFRLDPTEDGVKFVVLEDSDGILYLADYIGD